MWMALAANWALQAASLEVTVSADPGAICATIQDVQRAVAANVGDRAQAALHAEVHFSRASAWSAKVTVSTMQATLGERTFVTTRCDSLLRAIALHLSLLLERESAPRQPLPAGPVVELERRLLHWRVEVNVLALYGTTPGVSAGSELALTMGSERFAARLGLGADRTLLVLPRGVSATRPFADAGACWFWLPSWGSCFSASGGMMVLSSGLAQSEVTSPWFGLAVRLLFAKPLANSTSIPARLGLGCFALVGVTVTETRAYFDGALAWRSPVVWAGIGLSGAIFFAR